MRNALVEVRALTYRYPAALADALNEVQLSIAEGEFVVLAGASGSGKSSLLRALAGLVPHFFGGDISGSVQIDGLNTRDHAPNVLADRVASLFQDPESQVVMSSVDAELTLALEQRGWPEQRVARAAEEATLALGIPGLRGRDTSELSGGEMQRVALASVLAHSPKLALLDEPTSQLDPVAADELFALLHRLNDELGMTVVMSEHRLERCLPYADRVIALDCGRIACDSGPERFLSWALDEAPLLATPLARMFAEAGLRARPPSVKAARMRLAEAGLLAQGLRGELAHSARADVQDGEGEGDGSREDSDSRRFRGFFGRRKRLDSSVLTLHGVWHRFDSNLGGAVDALRDLSLAVAGGEMVALMGRNGAGKSTLLRLVKGLLEPTEGKAEAAGDVALLMQNPNDYFLHERVLDELPAGLGETVLAAVGLQDYADAHPHDLSAGQRQRLALAIVLAGRGWPTGRAPAVVLLDEPTRGIDRAGKQDLGRLTKGLAAEGAAVIIATHDVEFASSFATRVVLMADGRVIADGRPEDVLSGGWYYSTDVARALGSSGVIGAEAGAALIRDGVSESVGASL